MIGSAKTLAQTDDGWFDHPNEPDAQIRVIEGLWHSVLPGVLLRVVLVRHPEHPDKHRQLEAFFTTEVALSGPTILDLYAGRWSIEIVIRDANAYYGLGRDQCRRYKRIEAINGFRLVLAAAAALFFIEACDTSPELRSLRPWYQQKQAPTTLDVMWLLRESLWAN